jgi:esterase/lipase superfamily enzyme
MPFSVETIESMVLQAPVPFAVVLPQGAGPFPVLYDLHGLLSDEGPFDPAPTPRDYFEKQPFRRLQSIADETGTAIVRVNGGRGWYLDSPRIPNSQYQSHIVDELIPAVEKMFSPGTASREAGAIATATERSEAAIIENSAFRGISGHSMGGMGAINFLCRYPELFSVGAIHCASLRFMPGDHRGSFIEDLMSDEELRRAFPGDFLQGLIRNDLRLRVTVGKNDKERILRENRDLHRFLVQSNQLHYYEETPGGHEYIPHGLEGVVWAARQLGASRRDAGHGSRGVPE